MRKIFKYALQVPVQTLELPEGALILTVKFQDGILCLWALVDPEQPVVCRRVAIYGTGWDVPNASEVQSYIGTVMRDELVWHVFELTRT